MDRQWWAGVSLITFCGWWCWALIHCCPALALHVIVVSCCHVCMWSLHMAIGLLLHVVIGLSLHVLVTLLSHIVIVPCLWYWVVICGHWAVGSSFVRVIVHGCSLLGVIRWVGQDEGGKGGAHRHVIVLTCHMGIFRGL